MYCTNCGSKIPDQAKFCTECGFAVQQTAQPQTAAQEAAPAAEPITAASAAPSAPMQEPSIAPSFSAAPQMPVQQSTAAAAASDSARPARRYRGRLVLAVIACLLLFWPTGIPSIVFAAKAIRLSDNGDADNAAKAAKKSTRFAVLSLVCNIVWNLIGLILLVGKYA